MLRKVTAADCFLFSVIGLLLAFVFWPAPEPVAIPVQSVSAKPLAGSTVKIIFDGHGSGVHIGKGYILTAAHVVGDASEVKLKTDLAETLYDGDVLWTNKVYDVALVQARGGVNLKAADLSCRALSVGESIEAVGNPLGMEFVHSWGRIAGEARTLPNWKVVYVVDIAVAPGMSGGPIFDSGGKIVGITVGMTMMRTSPFTAAPVGLGMIVPASVACKLLGQG